MPLDCLVRSFKMLRPCGYFRLKVVVRHTHIETKSLIDRVSHDNDFGGASQIEGLGLDVECAVHIQPP